MSVGKDYTKPRLDCDIVMKGGITSGVIYPLAICKLAETYRLHSIGGASAGAIAASVAAAAEYARRDGDGSGFETLARLPDELAGKTPSGRTKLLTLFQPAHATRTAFEALVVATAKITGWQKAERIACLVLRRHYVAPLAGLAIACALFVGGPGGVVQAIALAIAALAVIAVGAAGGVVLAARRAYRGIAANFGGLCSGHAEHPPEGEPALCEWLADLIDRVAGHAGRRKPLTFAELATSVDPKQAIELAMMTTNLTHGRPYRLPFVEGTTFWFRPREMRRLFPGRVVAYLEAAGRQTLAARHDLQRIASDNPSDLLPLPAGDALPVIVAARMSLSFPVLLSAVPLYAVDWSTARHPVLDERDELQEHTTRTEEPLPQADVYRLQRCWFSDGGICSNLPIHFFDSLLPSRPTFALDLQQVADDDPNKAGVYIPETPYAGFAETWQRVGDPETGALAPASLIGAMVDTMQNWNDAMLAKAPGYRDRVVRINHVKDEGGMNLDMDPTIITGLARRGAEAGAVLGERFDTGGGWPAQRWVRYRSGLGMLQSLLSQTRTNFFTGDPPTEIDTLIGDPPGYRLGEHERAEARRANTAFQAAELARDGGVDFSVRAPRPVADLRPRPR